MSKSFSFYTMLEKIQVHSVDENSRADSLRNKDLIPMGPERRIWGYFSFAAYIGISNLCLGAWTGGSSLLSLGMNVGETMGVLIVANALITVVALLNGAPGGYFHVGFTVCQRMIFGIRGSYFGILMRTVLSIVWYAAQAWQGGLCLGMMLCALSPSYLNMENTFPESVHMTTRDCTSFLIFQLISMPLMLIKPEKTSKYVFLTNIFAFFGMLGIVCWAVVGNKGNGPLMSSRSNFSSTSVHIWAWIYGITSWFGSTSGSLANQSDYTRFSTKTWVSFFGTVFAIMILGSICPLMGLVTASATYGKFGVEYWNVYEIIELWLRTDYHGASRAGAFFAGFVFTLSQMGNNILGNGFSGGMDMAGLFPRYINIRRGAIITALLSWIVQPWKFYNTSSTFITALSSYSVFMTPVIGIMISEFWIIRQKRIKLTSLYSLDSNGDFWYYKGFNIKAFAAFLAACAPGLPGLINAANPSIHISAGIKHYYDGNCIFGLLVSIFVNSVLNWIFPSKNVGLVDEVDFFNTYTPEECESLKLVPFMTDDSSKYDSDVDYVTEIVIERYKV